MANFMKIAGKIMSILPKTEGTAGRLTLGTKQLQQIAAKDKEAGKLLKKALQGTTSPTLDVAYKAQSNYSIAGLRLKDGKNVIGQGAVSVTNPGKNPPVVKYRVSFPDIKANGFVDGGKAANAEDMAMSFARKGGKL